MSKKIHESSYDRTKAWKKANPERWKELQRQYRERKGRAPCKLCGTIMPMITQGKVYCSEQCRIKASREKDKKRRLTQKEQVFKHKESLGCSRCGYNKCGAALDWHHPNDNKERRITIRSYFTQLGEQEREKCILLCANCHREIQNEDVKIKENGDV